MTLDTFTAVVVEAPVTGGRLYLTKTDAVYGLMAKVGGTVYTFHMHTTTRAVALDLFEEEKFALSCGMDIADTLTGWRKR